MAKQQTTFGPVATPEGRISWPSLNEPKTGGKYPSSKYEATILMPREGSDFTELKSAVLKAAQLSWPELNIQALSELKLPFRNGDEKGDMPGYSGCIYINAKTKNKPPVVDLRKQEYTGPLKGGDYVRFSLTAGGFKMNLDPEVGRALKAAGTRVIDGRDEQGRPQMWRPAVTFYLNAVQFVRVGEAFSTGGSGGVDAFGDAAPDTVAADDPLFR